MLENVFKNLFGFSYSTSLCVAVMSGKPFRQNLNLSVTKFHACATVIYSPHFEKVSGKPFAEEGQLLGSLHESAPRPRENVKRRHSQNHHFLKKSFTFGRPPGGPRCLLSHVAAVRGSVFYYRIRCYRLRFPLWRPARRTLGVGGFEEACGHMRRPCREHSRLNSPVGTKSVAADQP